MDKTEQMEYCGLNMTNCDHTIDDGLAEALMTKPGEVYGKYPGWDFYAHVYYLDDKFHAEIMVYHCVKGIVSSESLEGLMESVSNIYGQD